MNYEILLQINIGYCALVFHEKTFKDKIDNNICKGTNFCNDSKIGLRQFFTCQWALVEIFAIQIYRPVLPRNEI